MEERFVLPEAAGATPQIRAWVRERDRARRAIAFCQGRGLEGPLATHIAKRSVCEEELRNLGVHIIRIRKGKKNDAQAR